MHGKRESRSGKVLSSLAIVPMFIPVVIGSYAILQFWSYGGFVKTIAEALGMPGFPDPRVHASPCRGGRGLGERALRRARAGFGPSWHTGLGVRGGAATWGQHRCGLRGASSCP